MLAMKVTDDQGCQDVSGAPAFFASMLAPTGVTAVRCKNQAKTPVLTSPL